MAQFQNSPDNSCGQSTGRRDWRNMTLPLCSGGKCGGGVAILNGPLVVSLESLMRGNTELGGPFCDAKLQHLSKDVFGVLSPTLILSLRAWAIYMLMCN
eukprot:m.203937 g.203937  ORF g.203937 m.203937 type:complete len:99 (-) comp15378_c0_seq3:1934-2230(-)